MSGAIVYVYNMREVILPPQFLTFSQCSQHLSIMLSWIAFVGGMTLFPSGLLQTLVVCSLFN